MTVSDFDFIGFVDKAKRRWTSSQKARLIAAMIVACEGTGGQFVETKMGDNLPLGVLRTLSKVRHIRLWLVSVRLPYNINAILDRLENGQVRSVSVDRESMLTEEAWELVPDSVDVDTERLVRGWVEWSYAVSSDTNKEVFKRIKWGFHVNGKDVNRVFAQEVLGLKPLKKSRFLADEKIELIRKYFQ